MNTRTLFVFPLLAVIALSGCATLRGDTEQQTAVQSFQATQKQMADLRGQIDRTMHSLDSMLNAPPAEIPTAFGSYEKNVEQLASMSQDLQQSAQDMRQQRINYMTEWERTRLNVEDPKLRQVADQRHQQVGQQLLRIEQEFQRTDKSIQPLVQDLQDIRRVLSLDPTPANVAAVKKSGVVQSAKQQAASLNKRLTVAINDFEQVLGRLSPEPGVPTKAAGRPAAAGTAAAAVPSFTQADRNQSGAIEQDEAGGIQGLDFSSADRDGDGRLSQSEYESATQSGSRSQDPTPGTAGQQK